MRQALELALEALETPRPFDSYPPLWRAYEKTINEAITAIKEALAQPEEEKLHPVHIGVDVTREGTAVTAFYRKPDAVMEMFYSQFHPMAQPEQEPVGQLLEDAFGRGQVMWFNKPKDESMLYTTPPQRTWVGLTMQDVKVIEDNAPSIQMAIFMTEATLKDKNHG